MLNQGKCSQKTGIVHPKVSYNTPDETAAVALLSLAPNALSVAIVASVKPVAPVIFIPFVNNATKIWGGPVNWRTAMAYDATQAIATGLKQSNTRDGLLHVLHSPSFSAFGATGTIQFLPSGDGFADASRTQRDTVFSQGPTG